MDKQAYGRLVHKEIFEFKHQTLNTLRKDWVYTNEGFNLNLNVPTFDWNMIIQSIYLFNVL